jgi:hypothetical protein
MNLDSTLQLYRVRSGDFSDYAPVMTAVWSLLEYVIAGPFPILALQSGLFLFGAYGVFRTMLTPRAAALTAGGVLLFPPVFSVMAVIWPESLMAGALIAAAGAIVQPHPRWKIAAVGFAVLAVACRFDAIVAVLPLALAILRESRWLRRTGLAIAITVGIFGVAWVADRLSTVTDTYYIEHQLRMMDVVGTLRRAKVKDEAALKRALEGMPLADPATLVERMSDGNDAYHWWGLANGDKRIFELLDTDEEAEATSAAWWRAITEHPGAYLTHRWSMARVMLGLRGRWQPVFDDLGPVDLLAPLHHRATPSDWQAGMQRIVRATAPIFRPIIYLLLGVIVIVLARGRPLLRALANAGLVYMVVMLVCALTTDYRWLHFGVAAVCVALAPLLAARRAVWRADG